MNCYESVFTDSEMFERLEETISSSSCCEFNMKIAAEAGLHATHRWKSVWKVQKGLGMTGPHIINFDITEMKNPHIFN